MPEPTGERDFSKYQGQGQANIAHANHGNFGVFYI